MLLSPKNQHYSVLLDLIKYDNNYNIIIIDVGGQGR